MVCDMTVESRIGASLVVLRESAGLSQQQLAERAATPVATVRAIERGSVHPPASLVARLTAVLAASLRAGSDGCVEDGAP